MTQKTKIVHVFGANPVGGVITSLISVLENSDPERYEHVVLGLSYNGQPNTDVFENRLNVPFRHVDANLLLENRTQTVTLLGEAVRAEKPDIVQCWGRYGNLLGGLVPSYLKKFPHETVPGLVWCLSSGRDMSATPEPIMQEVLNTTVALSDVPDAIICVSDQVRDAHEKMGVEALMFVRENGIDTSWFKPDEDQSRISAYKQSLGLNPDAPVIGMAGRVDNNKDQRGFIMAAKALHREYPNVQFILCGMGADYSNAELVEFIEGAGLKDVVHLLGARSDMNRLYHAADIWTSCSQSEAFGIAVVEAMASGKPCVVTDVGVMRQIIADTGGIVIPKRNLNVEYDAQWVKNLSGAWKEILERDREKARIVSQASREKVVQCYSVGQMAEYYHKVYDDILQALPRKKGNLPILNYAREPASVSR